RIGAVAVELAPVFAGEPVAQRAHALANVRVGLVGGLVLGHLCSANVRHGYLSPRAGRGRPAVASAKAGRVRRPYRKCQPLETPPHPDPLPASGEREQGYRTSARPLLIAITSRSTTRARKLAIPPSRQISVRIVSPGNTGAEKRPAMAVSRAGS